MTATNFPQSVTVKENRSVIDKVKQNWWHTFLTHGIYKTRQQNILQNVMTTDKT